MVRLINSFLLVLLTIGFHFFLPVQSFAAESAQVLPENVYFSSFLYGTIEGAEERFNSSGLLEGITAKYHVNLNSKTLQRLSPDIKKLIDALNSKVPTLWEFGDQLSIGTLDFYANPEVNYMAPIIGYGITNKVTVAVGVPIVK